MILAGMIRTDETALICDLAETYGVMDWKALPLRTAAALSAGLRDDSRIKMMLAGQKISLEAALLAAAVDRLSILVWSKTKDGQNNRNRPDSILGRLTAIEKETKKDDVKSFRTAEEFEAARQRALNKAANREV